MSAPADQPAVARDWRHRCAPFLLFAFALSLPPKWFTLHIAWPLLMLSLVYARAPDFKAPAMRLYTATTLLWLGPVLVICLAQQLTGLPTAGGWVELAKLPLRTIGLGMGLMFCLQKGWVNPRQALVLVLVALALNAVAGVAEWLRHPDTALDNWRAVRITGWVFNPNPFGLFMALGCLLCVAALRQLPRSAWLWAGLALFAFCLYASGSRGAMLALMVGLAVLFPPLSRRALLTWVAVFGALAVAYASSGWHASSAASDSTRTAAFWFSLDAIARAPLLGWGLGSFTRIPGTTGLNAPHNMLLDLALSAGLLPLLGWVVSTVWLVRRMLSSPRAEAHTLLALFAAAVFAGVLEYSLVVSTHFRGLWMLVSVFACWFAAGPGAAALPVTDRAER